MDTLGLVLLVALVASGFAAYRDLRTGHIPNGITLPLLVAAPLLHGAIDGATGLGVSLFGLVSCGLVPYLMFRRDAMGGGDVKLLAALGALVGPVVGLEIELGTFVAGSLYAMTRLAYQGSLLRMLGSTARIAVAPLLPERLRKEPPRELMLEVRLGPAIFAATAMVAFAELVPVPL
jgi:prepilin peptidase CpaA